MDSSTVLALSLGIGAALCWGVSDFLAAKATKIMGPLTAALYSNIIPPIVFGSYFLLFVGIPGRVDLAGVAYSGLGGVLLCFALMLFFSSLKAGPVSVVAPVAAAYPAATALFAVAVFHADLSIAQLACIGVVVIGVMAASGLLSLKKSERRMGRGPALALIASVAYGAAFAVLAQGGERLGWQLNTIIMQIACALALLIFAPVFGRTENVFSYAGRTITNKFVVGAALVGMTGLILLMLGFSKESSGGALVTAASACYPVITVVLALKHFDEELRLIPLAGAAASIAGIVFLSVL